jgi:hypothetical protein
MESSTSRISTPSGKMRRQVKDPNWGCIIRSDAQYYHYDMKVLYVSLVLVSEYLMRTKQQVHFTAKGIVAVDIVTSQLCQNLWSPGAITAVSSVGVLFCLLVSSGVVFVLFGQVDGSVVVLFVHLMWGGIRVCNNAYVIQWFSLVRLGFSFLVPVSSCISFQSNILRRREFNNCLLDTLWMVDVSFCQSNHTRWCLEWGIHFSF